MKKQAIITTVVVLIVIAIAVVGYVHYKNISVTTSPVISNNTPETSKTITISTERIDEDTFTGTKPVLIGSGTLANTARKYIVDSITTFAAQADKEVPSLRQEYGNDAPSAQYTIDINAKEIDSSTTQSLIIDSYLYMGGANGSSMYKAFTTRSSNGDLIAIRDLVKPTRQKAFVPFMQKKLLTWRPDGTDQPMIFEDEIKNLTIDSFSNFSLDDKNLTIYFDKYQIGPGALGAVAFPIPLTLLKDYILLPQ
ncbi:MAG: RsiV family protein [Candidatus Paceibacterota bacterium]